jgi:hypothetical protein
MTCLHPSQLFGSRFLFTCHDLYLSIAPSDPISLNLVPT